MTTSPDRENLFPNPQGDSPQPDPGTTPSVDPLGMLWNGFLKVFGSFQLCFAILLFMGLITYLGTRAQAHMSLFDAQVLYFDSWFVVHKVDIPGLEYQAGLPLPGGMLLMALLLVNLMVGGLMRIRISKRNVGVVITHLGVILLLLAGFIRYSMGIEGAIQVWEGGKSSQFQSYHNWELSVSTQTAKGKLQRWVIPWKDLADLDPADSRVFRSSELPFELNVFGFMPNSRVLKSDRSVRYPIVEGFYLQPLERNRKNAEFNQAGCYLTIMAPESGAASQDAILWAGGARDDADEVLPFRAEIKGKAYDFRLRRETHRLPFEIQLKDFRAIYYPRTMMPKAYESDVVVRELVDGEARGDGVDVNISMNQPLRKEGYALYQSSFGPQQREYNGPMFSVFSVAKNPSDQVPLIACLIIAMGMLIHFTQKFGKWVRKEQKGRAA